jgi:hypothetical protein
VGILFRAKRNVQIAADAAAMAAALANKYGQNPVNAANIAMTANGYATGPKSVQVIPNGGPVGCQACAEVLVSVPNPTFFMSMFGFGSISVAARAVAGPGQIEDSVYLLGGSGPAFNNGGSITLVNGGLIDNSNAADAFTNTGTVLSETNTGTVSAKSIGVVGGASGGGASTPTPAVGISPSGDPLSPLSLLNAAIQNAQPTTTCVGALNLTTNGTINPGCYNGLAVTGASIALNPGLYVINGPFGLGASSTLTGTGVTIFLNNTTTNPIMIDPSATMQLSASTNEPWNGILFFGSSTGTFALNGAAGSNLQGIIYLPIATLDLSGAGNMQLSTPLVVNQLTNTGASITLQDYLRQNPSSPLRTVTLLE